MANKIANAVSVGIGMDTRSLRRDADHAARIIGQTRGAFSKLESTLAVINKEFDNGKKFPEQYAVATTKAKLAHEKRAAALRKEAADLKALQKVSNNQGWLTGIKAISQAYENNAAGAKAWATGLAKVAEKMAEINAATKAQAAANANLGLSITGAGSGTSGGRSSAGLGMYGGTPAPRVSDNGYGVGAGAGLGTSIYRNSYTPPATDDGYSSAVGSNEQRLKAEKDAVNALEVARREAADRAQQAAAQAARDSARQSALDQQGLQFMRQLAPAQSEYNRLRAIANNLLVQGSLSGQQFAAALTRISQVERDDTAAADLERRNRLQARGLALLNQLAPAQSRYNRLRDELTAAVNNEEITANQFSAANAEVNRQEQVDIDNTAAREKARLDEQGLQFLRQIAPAQSEYNRLRAIANNLLVQGSLSGQQFADALTRISQIERDDNDAADLRRRNQQQERGLALLNQLAPAQSRYNRLRDELIRAEAIGDITPNQFSAANVEVDRQEQVEIDNTAAQERARLDEQRLQFLRQLAPAQSEYNRLRAIANSLTVQGAMAGQDLADSLARIDQMEQNAASTQTAREQAAVNQESLDLLRRLAPAQSEYNRLRANAADIAARGGSGADFAEQNRLIDEAERNANRQEGLQYMRQFETRQQRVNRQLQEARDRFHRAAITAQEYGVAVRSIRNQNSPLIQGFNQFRGALLTIVGPLVITIKAIEAFKAAVNLSAELDAARAKFRVFLGTATEANALLADIRELSTTSPISFAGGQRAVTTMLQFGVASNQVFESLKQIAEITGGNTERMESLSLAYAQTNAAGRLMGQELLQMVNSGFNPLKVISEQTGESLVDLKKRMEEGGVGAEEVAKAFKDATDEGGKFNGLLDEIATTTAGQLTKAASSIEKLGTAIGEALKPETQASLTYFNKLIQDITDLIEGPKKLDYFQQLAKDLNEARYELERKNSYSIVSMIATMGFSKGEKKAEIAGLEKELAIVKDIENVRRRIKEGAEVTDLEKSVAATVDNAERNKKNVNDAEFVQLQKKLKEDLAKAENEGERSRLRVAFADTVGLGFIVKKEDIEALAAMRLEVENLDIAAANAKRSQQAFGDSISKAADEVNALVYDKNAERVKMLREQSVGRERELLDMLIEQRRPYSEIVAAANEAARADAARSEQLDKELEQLQKIAETKKQDEATAKEIKDLESKYQYMQDVITLKEREARIQQLIRDGAGEITRAEAEALTAAERRLEAQEKLNKLREDGQELMTNGTDYQKMVNELAQLQVQLGQGFIDQDTFNANRDKLINGAVKDQTSQAQSPKATQKGSAEAVAIQAQLQVNAVTEQKRLADRAYILQKATADATAAAATVLQNIQDDLGVLPAP